MPAFFPILDTLVKRTFWHCQQLLSPFFFYLLSCSKTLSVHRCLQFWEEEQVSGGQVRWLQWLRHDYIHTYIIVHYKLLVRIIHLVSYITYVVCVCFEKLFLFTLRVFARNLLRGNLRIKTFRTLFWCLAWGSNPGFSSYKPTD